MRLESTADAPTRVIYFRDLERLMLVHAQPIIPLLKESDEFGADVTLYHPCIQVAFNELTGLIKASIAETELRSK